MSDIGHLKWMSAVTECGIHRARLTVAMSHVAGLLPLDGDDLETLSDEDAAWLDQLLFRFAKLQDTMGDRIFPDGLALLGEEFADRPFIDALNRMEALSLIPSRQWWMELREFRHQVAHESPDRREEQAASINAIIGQCDELIRTLDTFTLAVDEKVSAAD